VDGSPLRLGRDYIREGLREIAGHLCTCQLGYRTEFDALASRRSEANQHRYTSLDRAIKRDGMPTEGGMFLTVPVDPTQGSDYSQLLKQHDGEIAGAQNDGLGRGHWSEPMAGARRF
jgi:hypothetical protein